MTELVTITKTIARSACPECGQVFEHDPLPPGVWMRWECTKGVHRIATGDDALKPSTR